MRSTASPRQTQLTNAARCHEKSTLVGKFVKGKNETFWALRDINLTIRKGERVEIVGLNGLGDTKIY